MHLQVCIHKLQQTIKIILQKNKFFPAFSQKTAVLFFFFSHNKNVNFKKKEGPFMRGKMLWGAIACGAILGSAAAAVIVPGCMSTRTKRKIMRYKNRMMKNMGTVLDVVSEFRR